MASVPVQGVTAKGLARIDDAEKFLNMSRAAIYVLMKSGQLSYTKIGRSRRIPWASLEKLVQQNTVGS
jgi:excisionase family DNA binding protein